MAWNPSPKVGAAREFGKEFDKELVIILSVDRDGRLEYASYGKTKAKCYQAKRLVDLAFTAIMEGK